MIFMFPRSFKPETSTTQKYHVETGIQVLRLGFNDGRYFLVYALWSYKFAGLPHVAYIAVAMKQTTWFSYYTV